MYKTRYIGTNKQYLEFSFSLHVKEYSYKLLELQKKDLHRRFISKIDELSKIRRQLWEMNGVNDNYTEEMANATIEKIKEWVRYICKEFDLYYVEE